MRIVVLLCALTGLIGEAAAADYRGLQQRDFFPPPPASDTLSSPSLEQPVLRGSNVFEAREPDFQRWDGFYAGGQFAYGFVQADFVRATTSLVANLLRQTSLEAENEVSRWRVLGRDAENGSGFGGFIGYSGQWQDAVMSVELNYTRLSLNMVAPSSPLTRGVGAAGNAYVVSLDGAASMKITDLATIRGRWGWVFGTLMPYMHVGFAIGRADIHRSVTVNLTENGVPFSFSERRDQKGEFMYGVALGGGVEWALTSSVFLRGEYEFLRFLPVAGISPEMHQLRAGVGMRF
jgi:opacity protein-like surface antigen